MPLVVQSQESELVTLEQVKEWCRITDTDHDTLLELLIPAVREAIENFTGRSLVQRSYKLILDYFPRCGVIHFEMPPLRAVQSVKYIDRNGTLTTLSSSLYTVDVFSWPGRLALNYNENWPVTKDVINAVEIEFTAGYEVGNDESPHLNLPAPLLQASLFLIAHWFTNRELGAPNGQINEIPMTFTPLFFPYKVNF